VKNSKSALCGVAAALLLASSSGIAQQVASVAALSPVAVSPVKNGAVPSLVSYSGTLNDASGKAVTGVTGVTFLIYKDQQGGAPLWLETQSVTPDKLGHYAVQLGSTSSAGLPAEVFMSGEARWLGVQIAGEAEQSRVLLVAVPYAMKAGDAATIGGLPPSAFMPANPVNAAKTTAASAGGTAAPHTTSAHTPASSDVTTTGGTVNAIPLFTTATDIQNSILTQNGTTGVNVGGKLNLPALGVSTATAGKNSRPESFVASAFNSSTATAVPQTFLLQAEPAGNDTATPSGTLNLLYGSGATTPAETGFKISSKGKITFATGQTFPGAGELGAANTFTGNNVFNVSADADAVDAYTSGAGKTALVGIQNATSGGSYGVFAITHDSTGAGVAGVNRSSSATGVGVYGQYEITASHTGGVGVWGQNGSESTSGQETATFAQAGIGVWGDGGTTGGTGVLGTVDEGNAAFFENNSTSAETLAAINDGSGALFFAEGRGTGSGACTIEANGNLTCTGTKNAMVPVDGGKRAVAMSAIESPQNWFEDFGEAQLVNGAAVVTLDPTFIQTVTPETNYKVFPVPNGDCKGLYVTNKTANSFEVHELGGGTSNISFDYRVAVLRKSYENVRFDDRTRMMEHMTQMRERLKAGAGHPVSHDPVKKPELLPSQLPAKTAQLSAPAQQPRR